MEHPKKACMLLVAKIGRLVGVNGALKLHIVSDFPSIFVPKATFYIKASAHAPFSTLCVHSFESHRSLVVFEGYRNREIASQLVNCELYSTLEESKKICQEGEILWQELIGTSIDDTTNAQQRTLGYIKDIERIGQLDYFLVSTHDYFVTQGLPRQFFIPNISQYVSSISVERVITQNAFLLLQES